MLQLTTDRGTPILPNSDMPEPEPSSVVLSSGEFGSAWQLYFHDHLWHLVGSNGRGKTWEELLRLRNLVLVYSARERFDR